MNKTEKIEKAFGILAADIDANVIITTLNYQDSIKNIVIATGCPDITLLRSIELIIGEKGTSLKATRARHKPFDRVMVGSEEFGQEILSSSFSDIFDILIAQGFDNIPEALMLKCFPSTILASRVFIVLPISQASQKKIQEKIEEYKMMSVDRNVREDDLTVRIQELQANHPDFDPITFIKEMGYEEKYPEDSPQE